MTPSAAPGGDPWAIPPRTFAPDSGDTMDPNSAAEELPGLYRAILDRVAGLEADGERDEAARVRTAATRAYSRAWDDRARRQLEALLRRAYRQTAAQRPAQRRLRWGPARSLGRERPIVTQEP